MADTEGLGTGGQILSTAAPILNVVPYVGPLLSMAAGIGGGLMQNAAAQKQSAQAERIRREALATQKQALRPEFIKSMRIRKMQELQGMPGRDLAELGLDESIASNIRAIKESSPQGAAATAAISALVNRGNAQKRDLAMKDAQFRYDATGKVADTLWDIGNQERALETAQIDQRNQGLTAAAAMENAAMANKNTGINNILGSISSTATSLTSNAQQQQQNKQFEQWYQQYLNQQYANGSQTPTSATLGPGYTQIPGINQPYNTTYTPGSVVSNNPYNQYKTASPGFWK